MRFKKVLFTSAVSGIIIGVLAFGTGMRVSAAELNLTTSPLPINLEVKPGQSITADLRIQNSGTQTETLKIDLEKFKAYGEDGKPQLITREPGDDFFDWVQFSQRTFTAEPNVWKTVKMTVTVPKTAAYGYYYAVVFSRVNNIPNKTNLTNTIVGGSAVLVLVDVQVDGAKRQVDVLEFAADKKLYEFLPTTYKVRLRNSGAVHVAPSGTIFIMRGKKQVGTVKVNADKGNVLPGSNRVFKANWTDGFPRYEEKVQNGKVALTANGSPQKTLVWNFNNSLNKLRFGHYTAKMVLVYDNGTRDVPVEGTLSFWVVPWRIIGLAILVIAGVLTLVYRYRKLKKRLKKLTSSKEVS